MDKHPIIFKALRRLAMLGTKYQITKVKRMTFCQGWVANCKDKAERQQIIETMIEQQLITETMIHSYTVGRPLTTYSITEKGTAYLDEELKHLDALRAGAR